MFSGQLTTPDRFSYHTGGNYLPKWYGSDHTIRPSTVSRHWRFYIGARGAKPTQITKKEGVCSTKCQGWYIIILAGVVTLTELIGSAVATYEANEATA